MPVKHGEERQNTQQQRHRYTVLFAATSYPSELAQ